MAPPKGHKYAVGNDGGRPLKFTNEQLVEAGTRYFAEMAVSEKPLTVTGLCRGLGFTSRQMLIEYAEREDMIGDTIKGFVQRVAEYVESKLMGNSPTGAIFWLKNHGWADRMETKVEHSGSVEHVHSEETDKVLDLVNEQLKRERTNVA